MTSHPIDLIIFDCDGVLIDSEHLGIVSDSACLRELGFDVLPQDMMAYLGVSDADMLRDLESRFGKPVPENFSELQTTHLRDVFARDLKIIPGIRDVLDGIDCKICIASGSSPERLAYTLGLVGLYDRFAPHIFSSSQVARGKPAPDIFLFAAAQMNVPPQNCLVIEDGVAGTRGAVAAGMRVIGFCGGSHCGADHGELLKAAGAGPIFNDMREVATYLESRL